MNLCLLCGQVHRLYIHGYVGRLIRNADTEKNEEIVICVIMCHSAKDARRQYTKRMLPPFVTPECNITLENACRMFTAMPYGRIDYSAAALFLGTVCNDTIRRHYRMIFAFCVITVTLLVEYLTLEAPFLPLPDTRPGESLFDQLSSLMKGVCTAHLSRSGLYRASPPAALYLHPVYVSHKSRSEFPSLQPLNFVSRIRFFFDSS